MFYLSSMANCGSNVLILKSIEELRAKKKRPNRESVVSHAQKHHGLSIKDSRESLCCLLNNGSVFSRPTSAGLISLFVSEESNNTIAESIFNTSQDETAKSGMPPLVIRTKLRCKSMLYHAVKGMQTSQTLTLWIMIRLVIIINYNQFQIGNLLPAIP